LIELTLLDRASRCDAASFEHPVGRNDERRQSHGIQERIELSSGLPDHFAIAHLAGSIEEFSPFPSWSPLMVRLPLFLSLALLFATSCLAQPMPVITADTVPLFAIDVDKIVWTKNPDTGPLEFATVVGDRAKPGLYIQLVRWPPHAVFKAHSHRDHRYAAVLRGTFYHGFGEKFDESKLEPRPAGSFFTEPKGVRHFGITKDEGTILYFVGIGPSSTDNIEK
jgi:quercetin dioxygenase-like cupin family protein